MALRIAQRLPRLAVVGVVLLLASATLAVGAAKRLTAVPKGSPAPVTAPTLVVPDVVTAGEVETVIRGMRLPLLTRLVLFDVYTGDQIGPGRRSLAWSLTFQAPDRTLRDSEVNDLHGKIVQELVKRFNADIRGAA